MTRISRLNRFIAMLCVATIISGCQSSGNRWATAWKDLTQPKPNFQGVDGPEEVTYWPNRPAKSKSKSSDISSQLKEKFVKKSDQSQRDSQVAELINEGDQLRKSNNFEDARTVYTKALTISPNSADIHHRLAIVADRQHQYAQADEHYQAAKRIRPQDPKLLNDIGYSNFLRGNLQLAEANFKESLAIDRTHRVAMANLGMLYAQQNRYNDALEMFRNGMSETEAQQAVAQLFTQNQILAGKNPSAGQGHSNAAPVIASTSGNSTDLSRMTQDQVQAKMALIKQEAEMRRLQADQQRAAQERSMIAEDDRYQQQQVAQAMQNGTLGKASGSVMAAGPLQGGGNGTQQGFSGQQNMAPGQGLNGSRTGEQVNMAYASVNQNPAMNQSPGNGNSQTQFINPPAGNNPRSQSVNSGNGMPGDRSAGIGLPDQGMPGNQGNYQGAKIYRGPASPAQQGRPGDPQQQQAWDQRGVASQTNLMQQSNGFSSASQMATQLGMSAGPGNMFPLVQGSETDNLNMGGQNFSRNNSAGLDFSRSQDQQPDQNWSGNPIEQTSNMGGAARVNEPGYPSIAPLSPANTWGTSTSGLSSWQNESRSPSEWTSETMSMNAAGGRNNGQYSVRRGNGVDLPQAGMNSNPVRNENENARPYNGSWPNSNSLPQRQNSNIQINARSPETMEMMGINPNGDSGVPPISGSRGNNGSGNDPSTNSLPMYPYAPNR